MSDTQEPNRTDARPVEATSRPRAQRRAWRIVGTGAIGLAMLLAMSALALPASAVSTARGAGSAVRDLLVGRPDASAPSPSAVAEDAFLAPVFSMRITPQVAVARVGRAVDLTVRVGTQHGVPTTVHLYAAPRYQDLTYRLSRTVRSDTQGALTITNIGAHKGRYIITVYGTSGAVTNVATVSVVVK